MIDDTVVHPAEDIKHSDMTCTINGRRREARVPARRLLSDFLRHDVGLTGTHVGCEHGVCGACTVFVDGRPARACLMLAAQADGTEITTVEGLTGDGGELHPVMEALMETHWLQCGFCTPGFVVRIISLLEDNPAPTREEIVDGLAGNLCRCTGYQGIIDAVELAAARLAEEPRA
jgi:carbon-monoxide dehydrogenase small subunit